MKRQLITILGIALVAGRVSADDQKPTVVHPNGPGQAATAPKLQQAPEEKTDFSKLFKSDKEKVSYAIGMWASSNLKGQLKHDSIEIDTDTLLKAFKDNLGNGTLVITEAQEREILTALTAELRTKRVEQQKELVDKNKKEGEAFLAANKTKAGIKSFDSGLQYQVVTEGTGETPKPGDTVTASYRGTLIDGTEFDSSPAGQPRSFPVTGVIPGWTEALEHMKVGAKWKLFIPANLAYGERGSPPKIGPGATLIFDIELVGVKAAPAPSASAKPGAAGTPIAQAGQPLTSDIIKVPSAEELKKGAKIETIKAEDVDKEKAKSGSN